MPRAIKSLDMLINMGNISFSSLLKKYCNKIKPKRILEWGPGDSTIMMAEWCPDAVIASIEHQEEWYNFWLKEFEKKKITKISLFLKGAPEENREDLWWMYYTQPLNDMIHKSFDLIFIDGRERVRCMEYAKKVLNPGGVVILHDAQRGEYAKGIELFEVIDEDGQTKVMQ